MTEIPFHRDFTVEYGIAETVSPLIRRIVARNAGPFTFTGTGTYVVGRGQVAIIDPGPDLAEHIEALLDALRGETIGHLLITHTHRDHSPATAAIKRATGARSYGFGPHGAASGATGEEGADIGFVPDQILQDGDVVAGPGWQLTSIHTPGHTSNHLCYALAEEAALFTGDHVMGWSTSVIAPPDGNLGDYMRSLEKLLTRDDRLYWPTHGPAIGDPKPFVQAFIDHRNERSAAILNRLASGDSEIEKMVEAIYIGLAPGLRAAAARSVFAHLIEFHKQGLVTCDEPPTVTGRYRLRSS